MITNTNHNDTREQQLDDILAEYLRRKQAGETHAGEALMAEHAELASELREFFDNEARIAKIMSLPGQQRSSETCASASDAESPGQVTLSTITLSPTEFAPERARYRLDRFHDRGGMGEIWVGHDQRIGRDVAVKVLRHERADQHERFQLEAQISGQLEHPGIVRVYDYDLDRDGQPFYVMQFVHGRTLRAAIEESYAAGNPVLKFHRLLEVMVDLCHIVAYAHSRGVLHRDLKPDNVMLGAFGETLVLDWGLAKVEDHPGDQNATEYVRASGSGSSATQAGAVLGSPPYLSPEAASGHVEEVDKASDVYLLGATLYEILTSRPPRRGSSHDEIVQLARTADPPPPRSIHKSIPRPLEAICLKAMARRKQDRYATATEMATDLERFLAGEPVLAYPEGPVKRLARWAKKNRRTIGYVSAACIFLGVSLFGVAKWREAKRLRAYDQGAAEVADFRHQADKAHFLAASIDPPTEQIPYYDNAQGQRRAEQALAWLDRWGGDLSKLSLCGEQGEEEIRKGELKREIYDLTLLLVQTRLHESTSEETAVEALVLLDQASQLTDLTTSYYRLRAECHDRLGQHPEFKAARDRELDPATKKRALDYFLQGELHRCDTRNLPRDPRSTDRRDDYRVSLEEAIEQYEFAIREDPQHYWSHLQLGRCLMALERCPEAVRAFDACLALRPDQPWACTARSLAYALQGESDRAVKELERLIRDTRRVRPELHLNLGFVYLLRRDDAKAQAEFNRIMNGEESQKLTGAAFYHSEICWRQGHTTEAMADLNWVIGADPQFARAYLRRARLWFARGKVDVGLSDINEYLSLTAGDFDAGAWQANYERGRLLLDMQKTIPFDQLALRRLLETQALQQFQTAADSGGNIPELFQELGRLHFLAGNPTAALNAYEQGLERCPQSASLHLCRGWLFVEADDAIAAEEFEATLHLDPENYEALAALGYVRAKSDACDAAEQLALAALVLGAHDYTALFNIACIYGELGETDAKNEDRHHRDAIMLLRRAIKMWKDDGSPASRSLFELIDREREGTFRSLQYDQEFDRLLE